MEITSLETLKQMKKYDVVELSPFENGTKFIVKLQKPSMMHLISGGKVPNALLNVAMEMFSGKTPELATKATKDVKLLKDMVGMMEVLAEACLVEPSFKALKKEGINLTEVQLMEILSYSQGGVKALESFRNQ